MVCMEGVVSTMSSSNQQALFAVLALGTLVCSINVYIKVDQRLDTMFNTDFCPTMFPEYQGTQRYASYSI